MSIGENWLAPQPTANIANAILIQARGLLLLTVMLTMTSTLMRKPSNPHLTVLALDWGHGPGCRPGLGGRADGRQAPRADAPDPARRDADVGFGPGRGGGYLPVAGQRAPEAARRGRAGPRPAQRPAAVVLDRLGAGGRRARGPYPARSRQQGPLAQRREPGQEPALGADVLRPPGGRGRGLGHRGADRARPGHFGGGGRARGDGGREPPVRRKGGWGLRPGRWWRRGVRPVRHRRGPAGAADPAAAAALPGLERAPLSPGRQPGRRPDQEYD